MNFSKDMLQAAKTFDDDLVNRFFTDHWACVKYTGERMAQAFYDFAELQKSVQFKMEFDIIREVEDDEFKQLLFGDK